MLKLGTLGAVASEGVAFGLVTSESKVAALCIEALRVAQDASESAMVFLLMSGDKVPLLEMDLLVTRVEKGTLEELDRAGVALDVPALRRWLVNTLGLNAAQADLHATASKSVGDLLVGVGLVVTTGECAAWLKAAVIGRELICGALGLRLSFLV